MTFSESLLSLVFLSYCACYALSLRRGKTVFDTASGNEIHIGKNGHYSVWHGGDGQISFRIIGLDGREAPLSKPLFHASFRRTDGRITLLKQGRLKKGSYTVETSNPHSHIILGKTISETPIILLGTSILSLSFLLH